jgi:FkbM family methyltransferase
MQLDLSDWAERYTYFLGRYYDLPTQIFLKKYLRSGDHFVDIGANIGMISLLASHLVGDLGTVRAFEPNPFCCDRIDELISTNGLTNVSLKRIAISDASGELKLSVPRHSGMGTLGSIPTDEAQAYPSSYIVEVQRGDDALSPEVPIQVMKIDVEGYECKALAGCANVIGRWRPLIISEVMPDHLRRAGSTPEMLFELMNDYGYISFGLTTHRRYGRHELSLEKLTPRNALHCEDVVFSHPQSNITVAC